MNCHKTKCLIIVRIHAVHSAKYCLVYSIHYTHTHTGTHATNANGQQQSRKVALKRRHTNPTIIGHHTSKWIASDIWFLSMAAPCCQHTYRHLPVHYWFNWLAHNKSNNTKTYQNKIRCHGQLILESEWYGVARGLQRFANCWWKPRACVLLFGCRGWPSGLETAMCRTIETCESFDWAVDSGGWLDLNIEMFQLDAVVVVSLSYQIISYLWHDYLLLLIYIIVLLYTLKKVVVKTNEND